MAQIEQGINSLTKAVIRSATGHTAEIYTHGAHVTSWKNPNGEENLFLSENAIFRPPTAIRGGIPICWPQFSDFGPCKTQHGFARNSAFTITDSSTNSVTMELRNEGEDNTSPGFAPPEDFPQKFILSCKVSLADTDGSLHQELTVMNPSTSTEDLTFTCALHTYFNLRNGGIQKCRIDNLQGCTYLDSLQGRKECVEAQEHVVFPVEVDRIYLNVPDTLKIIDSPEQQAGFPADKKIKIEKSGFADAVVWNPHAEKAKKMADFGDDEWKHMVCVEVAQAGSGSLVLKPGKAWTGRQTLSSSV
jgi:glucose-6-phosphate 1-epimerase